MATATTAQPDGTDSATSEDTSRGLVDRLRSRRGFVEALPFLLPALAFYAIFVIYPMLNAIYLSFHDWTGFSRSPITFVGLDNYQAIFFRDPVFWTAFRNTFVWVGLSLLIPTVLALLIALAVNERLPGRNLFRTIFYLPAVLAPIAVASMWRWMYNPNFGVINDTLRLVGLDSWALLWLGETRLALYAVFVASVWIVTGLNMVLFLAGLQNVDQELVDAAHIDGAGPVNVFRWVTLPALRPVVIIVVVLTIINSLKVFDMIVGMTGGGPAQSTQVLALWSYTQSFGHHNFGTGNAIAVVLLVLTLIIVIPYLVWSMREEK